MKTLKSRENVEKIMLPLQFNHRIFHKLVKEKTPAYLSFTSSKKSKKNSFLQDKNKLKQISFLLQS